MRKILSMLLCATIIFTCVSCAAKDPEIVPEYDSSIAEDGVNFNGRTFIYGMVKDYMFEGEDSTLTYINGTDLGDLAVKRLKDIEDKYNCTIEFEYDLGRAAETAYHSAVGGQYVYDFISEESFALINYRSTNAFQDLTQLDNIDVFDETKWGSRYIRSTTMFDGAIIGVIPAAHPMRAANSLDNIIVINEDLSSNVLATDPREYYENGEWNWDAFENCLLTYAHTDSSNEFVYSLNTNMGTLGKVLACGNGFDFLTFDDSGDFELGYFSPNAIEAYNQAFEWFNGATSSNILDEWGSTPFLEGKSVIGLLGVYEIVSTSSSLAYQMENFCIMPPPTGPSADGPDDYRISYSSTDFTMCIPITAKDAEEAAFVLDKIYEPFEGYETKEEIIDYLHKNYFKDKRDAKFFVEMSEGEHPFFYGFLYLDEIENGVMQYVEAYKDKYYNEVAEKNNVLKSYETIKMYEEFFHD